MTDGGTDTAERLNTVAIGSSVILWANIGI